MIGFIFCFAKGGVPYWMIRVFFFLEKKETIPKTLRQGDLSPRSIFLRKDWQNSILFQVKVWESSMIFGCSFFLKKKKQKFKAA